MSHRITVREPAAEASATTAPRVTRDPEIVSSFLSDAAHVPGGHAAGITFPANELEVAAVVAEASRVLPVGAQSSLTGGATPRGEIVLSTRALATIGSVRPALDAERGVDVRDHPATGRGNPRGTITVGAGVPVADLQRHLAALGLYYPPTPTFEGAFVGGTIATNAAGAATFKYGSTRQWVAGLTIVLANGDVLDLARGETFADAGGTFEVALSDGAVVRLQIPAYVMPDVPKLSAGFHARPGMDLIDLFIGSEGTLGVIVSAALRVIQRPRRCLALVPCAGDAQAIEVTSALGAEARQAWSGRGPLDVAAIEYMDARALRVVSGEAFARAGVDRPPDGSVLLLLQIEVGADDGPALARLGDVLTACGVARDPHVTLAGDDRGAARLFELREAVPAGVNALVAAAKARVDPGIQKTAGDMIVPFDRLADSIALYRRVFERRGLDHAIWGHVSDGNLHPNVLPHSLADVERGHDAILEIGHDVIAMGGSPLAEHGVGRSALKQRLLRDMYGEAGIEQMRAVKRALDPGWKLAPGVLFPP